LVSLEQQGDALLFNWLGEISNRPMTSVGLLIRVPTQQQAGEPNSALQQLAGQPIPSHWAFSVLAISLIAALAYTVKARVSPLARLLITLTATGAETWLFAATGINGHEVTLPLGELLILPLPFGMGVFLTAVLKHHLTA
jgi:hypothetical protein